MRGARHGGWALAATLSLVAVGCHREGPAFLPTWSAAQPIFVPRSGSSNGYDALVLAAQDAQRNVDPNYLDRVWFTPERRRLAVQQSSSAINKVATAVSKPINFEFTSRGPFDPSPNDRGWRMIGRALVWRIETSCATANYDAAVRDEVTATKLGYSLTGGDVMDASLGFATVDDARKQLAPKLALLGAGQLNNLASGLERALDARPRLSDTFEHEKLNMLRSVQYVQDSFLKDDFRDLKKQLGPDVREAITHLEDLRDQSSTKQAAYFRSFGEEANSESQWLATISDLPLEKRKDADAPTLEKARPWRSLAKSFFSAGEPLLAMRDATLARTRLMILQARILARIKSGQSAPSDLSEFDKDLTTDPYTGRQFIYHGSGTNFSIYSVGEDLKDDLAETDEGFSSPDLTLEIPQN